MIAAAGRSVLEEDWGRATYTALRVKRVEVSDITSILGARLGGEQ